jgi:tRNA threonylcarbamoyl adenosine modification protein YjeE
LGELGSGKTTFTRSLIHQLQEKNKVSKTEVLSPTFNLLYEYEIKSTKVMHYDLYRLKVVKEIDQLGIFENLKNVITIIEWPEIIKKDIEDRLEISFYYEKELENRKIDFKGFGKWKNFKLDAI